MSPKRKPDDRLPIVFVPISSIRANAANPRKIDRGVPHVAASIRRFGFRSPIICRRDGQIVCGHTRHAAAIQLGLTEVPVHYFDGSDIEAVALGIADNRSAEFSSWDTPALGALLDQLREEDALEGVGFSTADIDAMLEGIDTEVPDTVGGDGDNSTPAAHVTSARASLPGVPPAAGETGSAPAARPMAFAAAVDDAGPEKPSPLAVSKPGDLWALGEHRLLCGDSTNEKDVARVLAGEKAVLFSTDPPYCVDYTGMDRPIHDGKPSGKDWSAVYREVDIKDLGQFLDAVFRACLPQVIDQTPIFVWHAHVQQPVIAAAFERHGLLLHQVLVWIKPCATFGHSYFRWRHEPVAFGWKKGFKPTHGMAQHDTVIEADWEGKARVVGNEHPCLHPAALVLTEHGYREIASIAVDDRVLAADGTFHPVTAVSSHAYGSAELVEIVAEGGSVPTLASDNHPFLIWRPTRARDRIVGGTVMWLRADEIEIGDLTMTPVMAAPETDPCVGDGTSTWPARRIEHAGQNYRLRYVKSINRVPYVGDVWNLSIDGCPTFQTAVGMSHNTQKPLRLFELPMEIFTQEGDVCLEPFSGSGSQILAGEKLRRRVRAIEITPAFVDAAIRRWQKATGGVAILQESGKTYPQVAEERGVVDHALSPLVTEVSAP